jgi:uncharacterized protein (TIGR03435 family)
MMGVCNASRIAIGCVLVLSARPAFGQAAAPPAFDVASVKPSDPNQTIAIKRSGNHIATVNTSLEMLITWAYDIFTDQLYGKPKWLDSVCYDVTANAPEERAPFRQMMQTLLAERFRLAVHRETRELPMYALVAAKGGPKVQVTELVGSIGLNPFSMPGRGRLVGTRVNAEMLAKVLANQLGRTVRDETGLKGIFDFKLEWEPGAGTEGASLFTAVQEQLGLKLAARKGPVEVLVIDHIESTPTEN